MEKVRFKDYLKERLSKKAFSIILIVYLALCLGSAVYWIIFPSARNLILSLCFTLFVPALLAVEYLIGFRCGKLFTGAVLFLAFGSILGTCFDLYTAIPWFDMLLHALSGVLFTALGFTFAEVFFGKETGLKHFLGCLIFGLAFSLAIAVLWEIIEYIGALFGFDMQEDSIVSSINSYLLSGGHKETVFLDGIYQTVIYYGNGQTYTIPNGYLELGLLDTLHDMIICTIGSAVFAAVAAIGYKACPKLNEMLIPQIVNSRQPKKDVANDYTVPK